MKKKKTNLKELINEVKSKNSDANIALIKKAFEKATAKNTSKIRNMEELKTHLLNSAITIAKLNLGEEAVNATLLHETGNTQEEIEKIKHDFGKATAQLVEEITKITEIEENNRGKISNEVLSRVILSTGKDIRSVFIKLATTQQNIEDIDLWKEKGEKMAEITAQAYVPICHKLGLKEMEWNMRDLAFKKLEPEEYAKIKKNIGQKREKREREVNELVEELTNELQKQKMKVYVYGRPKSFYSIYKKLKTGKQIEEIHDLLAARIICDSIKECYEALSVVHSLFKPVSKDFKDYIASPKKNNYKSIHTAMEWRKKIVEIQIRTWEMHAEAELGIAAHWKYKEFQKDQYFDQKLGWARQLADWQQKEKNAIDVMKSLKLDIGENKIFVLTPQKKVVVLPEGSTPIDFAFAIHSEIGYKCKLAKVNGKIVPLNQILENADTIEIITSPKDQAKSQWISFVRLDKAITKLKQKLGIKEKQEKKKHKIVGKKSRKNIRIANCCKPIPGDPIQGYKTTKRKISVHKKECKNLSTIETGKLVEISWEGLGGEFQAEIYIRAEDRPEILRNLLDETAKEKIKIYSTSAKAKANAIECIFKIGIKNANQLEKLINRLEKVPGTHSVKRR